MPAKDKSLDNLFSVMEKELDRTVKHFRSDFKIDMDIIKEARNGSRFCWALRKTGTYMVCLSEFHEEEFLLAKLNPDIPSEAFYYIEKKCGNCTIEPVTREECVDMVKHSMEDTFESMRTGDALHIGETGLDGKEESRYYVKIPSGRVMEVSEQNKGPVREFDAVLFYDKNQFFDKVREKQQMSVIRNLTDMSVHPIMFNEMELKKLFFFQKIQRKNPLRRTVPKINQQDLGNTGRA